MPSSPAPRNRRSVRSHEAVLAAAAAVVDRRGYRGAAIEEIAAEAGVAKQTIYRWWPDKTALFIEVYERLVPRDAVAPDTGRLADDLDAVVATLAQRYADTAAGAILSGLIADAQADEAVAGRVRDLYVAPRRAIIATILERAALRGEIPPQKHPDLTSDLFSGAIWFRLLLGERRLDETFTRWLVATLVHSAARDTD